MAALKEKGVLTQVHYIPIYWHPYYQSLGFQKGLCPNAEKIYESILSIPLFPAMTDNDVQSVINIIKEAITIKERI